MRSGAILPVSLRSVFVVKSDLRSWRCRPIVLTMAAMTNQPAPQVLLAGIAFGESPRWHDGRLWFSDWLAHEIIAMTPGGQRETVLRVPYDSFPFSIDW